MNLRQKQSAFARLVARLILQATAMGYEVTFGEAYRSPEEAARLAARGTGRAIKKSLHTQRLAIDLNLFKDGIWLTKTDDHRPLGQWWEAQSTSDVVCTWGGHFDDGNHYSVTHGGAK